MVAAYGFFKNFPVAVNNFHIFTRQTKNKALDPLYAEHEKYGKILDCINICRS